MYPPESLARYPAESLDLLSTLCYHLCNVKASMRNGNTGYPVRDEKFDRLVNLLRECGSVLVAYSGGVDSSFLLKIAHDVLGDQAVGVLAFSESLDRNEDRQARELASELGLPLRVIETREYENDAYRRNDAMRCYHCKSELFTRLVRLAQEEGIPHVLDGSNADDQGDFRPGMKARVENGVRSPLIEVGMTKSEIRQHARRLGLPTWDKPAAPCLSSRIPYGTEVSREKLRQIESAEAGLRELGFRVVRVRHHGDIARIEIPTQDFPRFLEEAVRASAVRCVEAAGFRQVVLDMKGFRSGSLNEALGISSVTGQDDAQKPGEWVPVSELKLLN